VKFAEVLAEDADLRGWFESLGAMPEAMRAKVVLELAGRMKSAGEHREMIEATSLLACAEVFSALRRTLDERATR
jgi:hypothetical protein